MKKSGLEECSEKMIDSANENRQGDICRAERDFEQALLHYRRAAAESDPTALNNLGEMYRQGLGVEHDYRIAAACFLSAAEQGYAPAQRNIGNIFKYGRSVPQDLDLAQEWNVLGETNDSSVPLLMRALNRALEFIDLSTVKEALEKVPEDIPEPEIIEKVAEPEIEISLPEPLRTAGYAVGSDGRSAKVRRRILTKFPIADVIAMLEKAISDHAQDHAAQADLLSDLEFIKGSSAR